MKNPHFVRIQKILGPLVRFLFPISLEGTENLPEDRPVMLCANHSSAWDPVLFVAAIWTGYPLRIMAKKQLLRIPILGSILKAIGVFAVDRGNSDIQAVKTAITTPLNAAKSTVSSIFDSIKSAISDKINGAKDAVHSAIEAIKDKFNFTWSLPHLKLPHISITGSFSLSPPSAPHFSVSWYKKAMGNAMILDGASIFGAMGGQLLGGGEAGREVVAGEDHLMGLMRQTVGGEVGGDLAGLEEKLDRLIELLAELAGVTIQVNGADYRSKMELAEAIMEIIDRKRARREAAYG